MRRTGIINGPLARAIAELRHTELFLISDCGFPAGDRDRVIDLAVVPGLPEFGSVLEAVIREVVIEESWIARETAHANPTRAEQLAILLASPQEIPHVDLKRRAADARFIVRTGDHTPYSNVLLRAGYPFA